MWLWILGSRELSRWLATLGMAPAVAWSASAELDGSPLDRNLYTALLGFGVIALLRRRQEVARLLKANVPIVVFFLYCAASVLWSDFPLASFKRWIKAVTDLVMVMIVVTDSDPLAALKRLLARTGFLLVPLSILVIKYYPDIGVEYKVAEGKRVITGLTDDKNALGTICMVFGMGFLWRFLAAYRNREGLHRTRHLIAHSSFLAMVVWIFLKANSMTSLICFVLASGLIVATGLPAVAQKRAVVNLLVATVLAGVAVPLFLNIGTGLFETVGRDASVTGRTNIWKLALAAVTSPILGAGFESFWLGLPLDRAGFSFHVNEAHNGYIEVYLNLGLVGVILLAVVIATGYRNVMNMLRVDPEAAGLRLAFWVVGVTYSMTEAGFRMMNLVWICFLLAAVAVSRPSVPQSAGARAQPVTGGEPAVRGAGLPGEFRWQGAARKYGPNWKGAAQDRQAGGAMRTEASRAPVRPRDRLL